MACEATATAQCTLECREPRVESAPERLQLHAQVHNCLRAHIVQVRLEAQAALLPRVMLAPLLGAAATCPTDLRARRRHPVGG